MAGPLGALISTNFRTWISTKGFLLVLTAAFIPLILAGGWVTTHRSDVAATDVSWEPQAPIMGQPVNITAVVKNTGSFDVGPFNATIIVGPTVDRGGAREIQVKGQNSTKIDGLKAGETRTITMTWTPSALVQFGQGDFGTYELLVDADANDDLGELNEVNNRLERNIQIQIGVSIPDGIVPLPPGPGLQGSTNSTKRIDLAVSNVTWEPREVFPNATIKLSAEVRNLGNQSVTGAVAVLRAAKHPSAVSTNETSQVVDLAPGESRKLEVNWVVPAQVNPFEVELYRIEAWVRAPLDANDTDIENNLESHGVLLDRKIIFPEPPERATLRGYHISVVSQLLLPFLVPWIALYYAAGVLSDERDKGNLAYLLTRPIPRWSIPVARFVVSYALAGTALAIGTIGSFALIIGFNQADVSYLWAPLILVLLALFAYGGVFTLLGVFVERPYLLGAGYIMWEWFLMVGRDVLINGRPVVAPWVLNLTVFKWLERLTERWTVEKPLEVWPTSGPGWQAIQMVLLIGAGLLVVSAYFASRREYDV